MTAARQYTAGAAPGRMTPAITHAARFAGLVQRSAVGGLEQGLGFLFGVARGILLVAIAFFVYDAVVTDQSFTMVDERRSALVFEQFAGRIQDQNPEEALGWVTRQYEALVGQCAQ